MQVLLLCVAALAVLASAAPSSLRVHRQPHTFTPADIKQPSLSGRTRRSYAPGATVPMAGGYLNLGYYYTNITIGTPPQSLTVLVDTGSSNLAVPIPACSLSSCGPYTRYNPAQSSTSTYIPFASHLCQQCNPDGSTINCPFGQPYGAEVNPAMCGYGISYGGGSSYIDGMLVSDVVNFGGYRVNTTVVGITREIPDLSFSTPPVDGILGLAHEENAINPTYVPTIFGVISGPQYKLAQNIFGICLDPVAGGTLDLGYVDTSKFSGPLQWVPVVQQRWYNFGVVDVALTSSAVSKPMSIGMPSFTYGYVNDQIGTFIDSGTSTFLLGPTAFNALVAVFQSPSAPWSALPGVSGDSNLFNGACVSDQQMGGQLANFPVIQVILQGFGTDSVTLEIPPTAYLLHAGGQYCGGIAGVPSIGMVLGDVVMQGYYIVHDRDNQRVGFAPVDKCV